MMSGFGVNAGTRVMKVERLRVWAVLAPIVRSTGRMDERHLGDIHELLDRFSFGAEIDIKSVLTLRLVSGDLGRRLIEPAADCEMAVILLPGLMKILLNPPIGWLGLGPTGGVDALCMQIARHL